MHIPDAYLSPMTEGAGYCVMLPLWAMAARRTAKSLQARQVPTLAVGSAFCFAIQMFNVPAAGGTTAHALGATLLAILVGPWAALLGVSLSLAVQALLFGDGGVLSYGINCFNMGFIASFVGWWVYRLAGGDASESLSRKVIAGSAGAYIGTVAASLCAGIVLGIQPLLAHDASGHSLYFPFALSIAVPGMVISHLIAAGPADAVVTAGALAYLSRSVPELISGQERLRVGSFAKISRAFIWVMIATPLGLIAAGDAWGEWDLDKLKSMVGYAPAGIAKAPDLVHPALPDYGFSGAVGTPTLVAGYVVSAFIGCSLVALVARALIRGAKPTSTELPRLVPAQDELPAWMLLYERPVSVSTPKASRSWLEATLTRMRASVEHTVASEQIAHAQGFLQQIAPEAKVCGFLLMLVGVGLTQSIFLLIALFVFAVCLAWASAIPVGPLLLRVAGTVAFFGIPIIASVLLTRGTSHDANLIASRSLLRLAAGITLAVEWSLTTKWAQMIRAFRLLRVPTPILTSALLAYRYLFVLVETASEMVTARTARQVGAWSKAQARSYAGSAGAILFAKSMSLTDEVHQAMTSRGLEMGSVQVKNRPWRTVDMAFALAGVVVLCLTFVLGGLHAV